LHPALDDRVLDAEHFGKSRLDHVLPFGFPGADDPRPFILSGFRGAGCRPVRQKSTCEGRAPGNAIMQKRGFYSRNMDNCACFRHSGRVAKNQFGR
jgi:hypothetical protein